MQSLLSYPLPKFTGEINSVNSHKMYGYTKQEEEIFKIRVIENIVTSCSLFVELSLAGIPLARYIVRCLDK